MNSLCSHERLELALAGSLNADDEATLHLHLEACESCFAEMARLAGGEQASREIAAMLIPDDFYNTAPLREECSTADFVVDHLEPSDDPAVLGRLGGYDVLDIIGRGGMGVVLKGFDRELKRFVAIKALAPHLAHSALARKRFAREAQAAAAVVNLHVIAIHQVQPNGQLPFLVMPLLTGESLAQRLKARGTLELKEILRIGMQAAEGLAAAHGQGLIHRDVKPANILLEKGVERAVLTDFGLARAADDISMTRLGVIAGTPEYMSPEQARGEALDGRSDLFSLGCVLYEMATGVSPFRTDSTMATLRRIVDEQPAAMASLVPELPPWFSHIVERLLSKAPAQRFASASEVSQLLEHCLQHLQQPTSVPLPASLVTHAAGRSSIFKVNRKGVIAMFGTIGMTLLGLVLQQATEAPDISGPWTSDEWGTVVLEEKGPGLYEGTFTGSGRDKPVPSNDSPVSGAGDVSRGSGSRINVSAIGPVPLAFDVPVGGPGDNPLGFGVSPKSGYDALSDSDKTKSGSLDSKSFQSLNKPPGGAGAGSGLPGAPGALPVLPSAPGASLVPEADLDPAGGGSLGGNTGGIVNGPSTALDSGKGKSGTLHLKWSRLERRFNGTWGKGADRSGTMSLRLVDKEIRGGFKTDEEVQLETGTPLVGDLLWTRSVVSVPDGGTVLLGGLKTANAAANTPRKLIPGEILVEVYGGRGIWKSLESRNRVGNLLHSLYAVKGVTVDTHEDGEGDAFTKAAVHMPTHVGEKDVESKSQEESLRTIKIAIGEALRAHKVPNIRWLVYPCIAPGEDNRGLPSPLAPAIKTPLDRQNARAVVEAFVAAAFPFDDATFNTLARLRDRSEAGVEALCDDLRVARLPIQSVYVNDPAKPTRALASTEAVRLEEKLTKHGQRDSVLVLTLTMSDEGWLVTDIDIESEESADRELKKFLEANPKAIGLPPQGQAQPRAAHVNPLVGHWKVIKLAHMPVDQLAGATVVIDEHRGKMHVPSQKGTASRLALHAWCERRDRSRRC